MAAVQGSGGGDGAKGRRHELTDAAWVALRDLLPTRRAGGRGRPARDERQVINGVLWILATGCPWRDLPERYGPWQTCYHRFNAWAKDRGGTTWRSPSRSASTRSSSADTGRGGNPASRATRIAPET